MKSYPGGGRCLIPALLLKSERKHHLPFWEDRFYFSNSGSERTWPFPNLLGICDGTKKAITQNCAKGCAGRYAQNSAHLRTELKIQL
nr:MAG TPA: hypothetical protein [Caudoviricetes sp.]